MLVGPDQCDPMDVLPSRLITDLYIPRQLLMLHFLYRHREPNRFAFRIKNKRTIAKRLFLKTLHLLSINMRIDLCKAGFIVGGLFDNTEFNQIKGINITGHIRNKELYRVDIINNAECIYYLQEEDSSLIGINTSITNEMSIFLEENKISQIRFYDQPDGKIHPDKQLEDKDRKLQDFRWLDEYRPYKISDLYIKPIPRYRIAEQDAEKHSSR